MQYKKAQGHPVLLTFCAILHSTIENNKNNSEKRLRIKSRSKTLRNKWFIAYTLINNISLVTLRKNNFNSAKLKKKTVFKQIK